MLRSDIEILVVGIREDADSVSISFYNKDLAHPAAKETFDDLINDMTSFISEFPTATISAEK